MLVWHPFKLILRYCLVQLLNINFFYVFFRYVWAGLLIVLGIYLNVLGKTNFDFKINFKNTNNIFGSIRKRRKSPMVV